MSIGSDLKSSLSGNIETALLVIHDYRNVAEELKKAKVSKETALLALQKTRSAATAARLSNTEPVEFPLSEDRILRVQFNPAQLQLYAAADTVMRKDAETGESISLVATDARLFTLTTVLYFDDMDTYDSFMWDRFTAGLTASGVSSAVSAGRTLAGKEKVHTVQWRVEALIAALRNPYTRTISFRWADFSFIGQLSAIHANYTMFSTNGRPVRAEVMMQINHEMDPAMLKHWYQNFDTVFGGDSSTLVRKEQSYNSLINLNL
jgi:hypothetical protein